MKKLALGITLALVASACAQATEDDGIAVEDVEATSAIEEPTDEFRPYANVEILQDDRREKLSFYLDELHEGRAAYRGCSGEVMSLCGGVLAYCEDGEYLNANSGSPIAGGDRCLDAPDEWDMHRRANCPLTPDNGGGGYAKVTIVTDSEQAKYSAPATESLGDPVSVAGVEPDDGRVGNTDGTTQPTSDSSTDSSDSTGATEQRERPSGSTPTSQPGQL